MSKLDESLSRLLRGCGCKCDNDCGIFDGKFLIIIAIVFLVLCTDILDDIFCNDSVWIWVVLIALLLFNFDDGCCC